jgi:hypothetical protein
MDPVNTEGKGHAEDSNRYRYNVGDDQLGLGG